MDKVFDYKWMNYVSEYEYRYAEEGDDEGCPPVEDMIKNDLEDKGFSKEEIQSLMGDNPDTITAYKFLAYAFSLDGYFDTIEGLEKLVKEKGFYEQLTDDDLMNILIQVNNLN